jgi:hypothetical protein
MSVRSSREPIELAQNQTLIFSTAMRATPLIQFLLALGAPVPLPRAQAEFSSIHRQGATTS